MTFILILDLVRISKWHCEDLWCHQEWIHYWMQSFYWRRKAKRTLQMGQVGFWERMFNKEHWGRIEEKRCLTYMKVLYSGSKFRWRLFSCCCCFSIDWSLKVNLDFIPSMCSHWQFLLSFTWENLMWAQFCFNAINFLVLTSHGSSDNIISLIWLVEGIFIWALQLFWIFC